MISNSQKKMKNYIKIKKEAEKYFTIKGIEVSIEKPLPEFVIPQETIRNTLDLIPSYLLRSIKYIKIGQFKELVDRALDAYYENNTIYLTNLQKSPKDMVDDIVHEVAHSVEELHNSLIYSDNKIKQEFLRKREILKKYITKLGFTKHLDKYSDIRYNLEFDMFLYKEVGYNKISKMSPVLFLSPYAATSLREYFANGFENFFLKEKSYQILKKTSPALFEKLIKLLTLDTEIKNV